MKCPFRVGVQFEYTYVGADTDEERHKSDNYVESNQHSVFEECYGDECSYYNWNGRCDRIGD